MTLRHLPGHEFLRQRWQNGLGWTREIIRIPEQRQFAWRCSIAEIDHDCPYSPFPGYRRLQVLLEGEGFSLRFADGRSVELRPPHDAIEFDGEQVPHCHLHAGPVRVFNLIVDARQFEVERLHRPLVGPMVFPADQDGDWLIYQLRGEARVDRSELQLIAGDALHVGAGRSTLLDGGGELLLFRLRRRDGRGPRRHRPDESR